jgi:hypothetical protein
MMPSHPPTTPGPRPLLVAAAFSLLGPLACLHAGDRAGPAAATVVAPASASSTPPAPDARAAVLRALVFLEKDGVDWMNGRAPFQSGEGCVSCHHVGFGLWSHREAQRAGLSVASDRIDALEKQAHGFYAGKDGEPVPWSQLLLGRETTGKNHLARIAWPSIHDKILEAQEKPGHWEAGGQFPSQRRPRVESDAVATMWILLAFAGSDDLAAPVAASRARAFSWIEASPPGESNEWLLTRMLVERRLGDEKTARSLRDQLLAQQQADGGWSWLRADPSNAYSTGQTLYALALAGLPATDASLRRAVGYLLTTQQPDGTWLVPSKLTSKKGSTKRDYIYKYWGTAWATIGLARTLQPAGGAGLAKK